MVLSKSKQLGVTSSVRIVLLKGLTLQELSLILKNTIRFILITGGPGTECDRDDLLLYFPFDDHFNDVECNHAHSDVYGHVVLSWDAKKGRSAYFDGSSRLTVEFLNNWSVSRNIMSISYIFRGNPVTQIPWQYKRERIGRCISLIFI